MWVQICWPLCQHSSFSASPQFVYSGLSFVSGCQCPVGLFSAFSVGLNLHEALLCTEEKVLVFFLFWLFHTTKSDVETERSRVGKRFSSRNSFVKNTNIGVTVFRGKQRVTSARSVSQECWALRWVLWRGVRAQIKSNREGNLAVCLKWAKTLVPHRTASSLTSHDNVLVPFFNKAFNLLTVQSNSSLETILFLRTDVNEWLKDLISW